MMFKIIPRERLIVGLEDDADGSLRVYVDARWTGIHTHVDDPEVKDKLRRSWGSSTHLTSVIPDSVLCDCQPTSEEAK